MPICIITVSLDTELATIIEAAASAHHCSRSSVMRDAFLKWCTDPENQASYALAARIYAARRGMAAAKKQAPATEPEPAPFPIRRRDSRNFANASAP